MTTAAARAAFEAMAERGRGDAGALALGLRNNVTSLGLRALAAKAVHVAAAAPERLADVYDNASAGWLSAPVFPPRLGGEPLAIAPAFWKAFWGLVDLPRGSRRDAVAYRTLMLAGELDPQISGRMAVAALEFPGVAEAAAGGLPEPFDLEALAACPPASLGFLVRQEAMSGGGLAEPFGGNILPLLRHMPAPLNYINIRVIQSLPVLALVAGYSPGRLDRLGLGGFLMGQVAHHYSAISTALSLTLIGLERPEGLEVSLDSILKGWRHGRETPQLIGAPWEEMWTLRIDQIREALGVTPFDSPYAAAGRALNAEPPRS